MSTELEALITSNYLQRTYPTPDITESLATEMAAGTEPEGAKPMSLRQFAETAADAPAGLLKGAIQGTAGLAGDVEMIASGVKAAFPTLGPSQVILFPVINAVRQLAAVPGDALDRFLKAVEEETIMPTTEDVKKWLDANVGPLVPEGADAGRREAAKTAEFVGELGGAGKTIIGGTKASAQLAKSVTQSTGKAISRRKKKDSREGLGLMKEDNQ